MKINLFKVLLFTFLVSSIITTAAYFLLLILFNDSLTVLLKNAENFFLISFAEISGILIFSILFMVSYFLPLYHSKKNQIMQKTSTELFWNFMPLVCLIASLFAFFILLISNPSNGIEGEGWINMWLIYILSYSGLIAFVYRIKKPTS
ncbi:MAG TPA: hypothetical protein PLI16_01195 [Bacteroidales bacterium]|nr:hypothetical protein [Bacteroidales bacterium]HNZ43116.1 hypothetical protein [Bacteroidales bacterium]HOH83205.1 hypothetical protein [Bacteroidales bacterium]HPI29135.1 hypothetical protein [Bacteroidales bacterium]